MLTSVLSALRKKQEPTKDNWPAALVAIHEEFKGRGSGKRYFGRYGAALKPFVEDYGLAEVERVLRVYLTEQPARWQSPENLAGNFKPWQNGTIHEDERDVDPVNASIEKATREFPDQKGLAEAFAKSSFWNKKPSLT